MGELPKEVAKKMVEDGINFQRDLKIAKSDQSAEEMHFDEREAIRQRGDDIVPLEIPEKQKMDDALREKEKANQKYINRRRGFAPKGMRNIAKVSTNEPIVETSPKNSVDISPNKPSIEKVLSDKALEDARLEERAGEEEKRKMEFDAEQGDLAQVELNKAITDFEDKQAQIAEMRAKKTGRFASLAKSLGIKTKNISEDPEVMGLEKESHDLYRSLLSKGIGLYRGTPQLKEFLKQYDEFEVFKTGYNQELDNKAKLANFPESIFSGLKTMTKKWSEMSWKQKLAVGLGGGVLFGGGALALGAGTFGAVAIAGTWKWGMRAFGATAAGVGRNVMLDRNTMEKLRKESEARAEERLEALDKYGDNIDQGIEEMLSKVNPNAYVRKDFESRKTENALRATRFGLTTFAISVAVGETIGYVCRETGINAGTILHKISEKTGITLGGMKELMGHFLSSDQVSAEHGGMAGIAEQQSSGHINSAEILSSTGQPHQVEYSSGGHATENALNPAEQSHTDRMGGAVDQSSGRPSVISDTDRPHFAEQSHTDNVAKIQEIAAVKIKAGGSMWKGIENNIRENPTAYDLDPNDPGFKKAMNGKISEMLHDFAKKNGLSYKQLDKVFEGDNFKIGHDATGKPYLYDFHGKAFGGNVPSGGAVHEIAPSKGNIPVEDVKPNADVAPEDAVKPRTGAVDHQRGGGKMKFPPEVEALEGKAQASAARALESQQYADNLKAQGAHEATKLAQINSRLYLSTRGLVNQLVNGAGVGDRANFWSHSMDDWKNLLGSEYQISQDVQFNDATNNTNINLDKLRELYPILEKYHRQGIESIGDCLKAAVKNSMDLYEINKLVLRK
jgi:hypothetical protein